MKSCVAKCHQRAPLKVDNLEASEQSQGILMRRLSLGMQSSLLVVTQRSLRRSFHQPARCSWIKTPTLPGYRQREDATRGHDYLMQCEPD